MRPATKTTPFFRWLLETALGEALEPQKNLSKAVAALAEALGEEPESVKSLNREGAQGPTAMKVLKIADRLGVEPNEIILMWSGRGTFKAQRQPNAPLHRLIDGLPPDLLEDAEVQLRLLAEKAKKRDSEGRTSASGREGGHAAA